MKGMCMEITLMGFIVGIFLSVSIACGANRSHETY